MKFISWNVNGLRACVNKGFNDVFVQMDADFFCLQETKMQEGQLDLAFPGYHSYWNYAEKKGYSGTAIFTKHQPLSVSYGMGRVAADGSVTYDPTDVHNQEGRIITLEYEKFYLITVYVPNAQDGLRRLDYRMEWEDAFLDYIKALDKKKPVIFCGDLNVAHEEIDWSYRFHAREKNVGWRIDYFVVSERLMPQVRTAAIHTDIMGSDHCPVELEIED